MTIFKVTPGDMHEAEETYIVIPTSTLNMIESPAAFAVYGYLIDKPDDWIIRDKDVINRWKNMSKRSFQSAIRELKRLGLLVSYPIQDEDGKFTGYQRDLFAHPALNPDNADCDDPATTVSADLNPTVDTVSADSDLAGEFTGLRDDSDPDSARKEGDEVTVSAVLGRTVNGADGKTAGRINAPLTHNRVITHNRVTTHKEINTHVAAEAAPCATEINSEVVIDNPPVQEVELWQLRQFVKRHGLQPTDAKPKAIREINAQALTLDDEDRVLAIVEATL